MLKKCKIFKCSNSAFADDVKIGILLGFTGPIESLTPDMASGAELAIKEASDSGAFMGGSKILSVRGTQHVLTPPLLRRRLNV